ncbi:MAG: carboxylating nicotinate-nucleotide diphosphorylase [Acidaminobacteraceae bacterium]
MISKFVLDDIIISALKEDNNYIDVTTDILIDENQKSIAIVTFKESGILSGVKVFERVFKLVSSSTEVISKYSDGDFIEASKDVIKVYGNTVDIIKAERVALNLLQRMCGISTMSKKYSDAASISDTKVVDTRKTTPNLRVIEKYAVMIGGCYNHRFNLSDCVMIKDNHIRAVGSITEAIARVRSKLGHTIKIEVEITNFDELNEALESKADIIMLDNMSTEEMREAVKINKTRSILEASGNITIERVREIAEIGIDVISVGALTHSVKALDISLNIVDND